MDFQAMLNPDDHHFLSYSEKNYHFLLSEDCPDPKTIIAGITATFIPGTIIKSSRRRNVFILQNTVIKKYVFRNLSDKLHSQRYGKYEFACCRRYIATFDQCPGVRIPRLYGYFNAPIWRFFSSANGIVTEYIANARYLLADELSLAAPLFANLFRKGIYHPDMQIKNILYGENNGTLYPIDLIGCNFLPKSNSESLIIMLARFAFTARASKEQAMNLLRATLNLLPEFEHPIDRAGRCLDLLLQMKVPITTHQRKKIVFLPKKVRKVLNT